MSASPPQTLGKYQIIREIARSNDIVYEAYDPLMQRRVALKELAMPSGATPQQREERVRRFQREGQAAGALAHPNIMTVYELGCEGDRFYMALEYLDGHSLRNEIDTLGFLPLDQAARILKDVLKGLQFAHEKGVIHRDIKPDNVQLLANGAVKITDFGIARMTFQPNLTMDGQVFGTPSYMSPEQVVGKEIDARSDLFSAGVMFYEMLSGRKPFHGQSVMETTAQIMNRPPDPLPGVDPEVWRVIEIALEKSPPARFASASAMIDALDRALAGPAPTVFPAPAFNPYGPVTPQVQTSPPPVVYPYNPYSSAPPQNVSGTPPPVYGLPPANLPPYYPPPPRPPLLTPDQRLLLGRVGLTALVLGAMFFLVWVATQAVADAWQNRTVSARDREVPVPVSTGDLGAQVQAATEYRQRVAGDDAKIRADARLARLRVEEGRRLISANPPAAEARFREAMQLDPGYGEAPLQLGDLFYREAQRSIDADSRVRYLQEAGQAWGLAAKLTNGDVSRRVAESSAGAYIEAAQILNQAGERNGARAVLYEARQVAPPGSDLASMIQQAIAELSGG